MKLLVVRQPNACVSVLATFCSCEKTLTKNFGKEKICFLFILPGHSPPLREVRAGAMEVPCLLSLSHSGIYPFMLSQLSCIT